MCIIICDVQNNSIGLKITQKLISRESVWVIVPIPHGERNHQKSWKVTPLVFLSIVHSNQLLEVTWLGAQEQWHIMRNESMRRNRNTAVLRLLGYHQRCKVTVLIISLIVSVVLLRPAYMMWLLILSSSAEYFKVSECVMHVLCLCVLFYNVLYVC